MLLTSSGMPPRHMRYRRALADGSSTPSITLTIPPGTGFISLERIQQMGHAWEAAVSSTRQAHLQRHCFLM